jgi:hypothetical protein
MSSKLYMKLMLLTMGCAGQTGGMPPKWDGGHLVSVKEMYPDVVEKTFADWGARGLEDTSKCDPGRVWIKIMNDAAFDKLMPETCGFFDNNGWTIVVPVGVADETIEHELVHWLAGCTGRHADYDHDHKDVVLYDPTARMVWTTRGAASSGSMSISTTTLNCSSTALLYPCSRTESATCGVNVK